MTPFVEWPAEVRNAFAAALPAAAQRYHWTKPGQREYWTAQSRAVAQTLADDPAFAAAVLAALTKEEAMTLYRMCAACGGVGTYGARDDRREPCPVCGGSGYVPLDPAALRETIARALADCTSIGSKWFIYLDEADAVLAALTEEKP